MRIVRTYTPDDASLISAPDDASLIWGYGDSTSSRSNFEQLCPLEFILLLSAYTFFMLSLISCKEIPTSLHFIGMASSLWTRNGGDGKQLRYGLATVSPQTSQQD
ncbi:MAG: hypothetical protein MJZ52_00460 [Bacteroidales bacterium]|nr:hypothetical protein [Bacteroidales bacterium]